jgi:putative N-acetylmannosamine-6-phosphate epimerase
MMRDVLDRLKGGLIVSCQAEDGSPFYEPGAMARFARAAKMGGASGIRAKEPDIRSIRDVCDLPIIGIDKVYVDGFEVYITPRFADAQRIADAGAEIIALDCTPRPRPGGAEMGELVQRIGAELGLPVMADIATLGEALAAERAGCDIVATTLSGHTSYSQRRDAPDWDLLEAVVRAVEIPTDPALCGRHDHRVRATACAERHGREAPPAASGPQTGSRPGPSGRARRPGQSVNSRRPPDGPQAQAR